MTRNQPNPTQPQTTRLADPLGPPPRKPRIHGGTGVPIQTGLNVVTIVTSPEFTELAGGIGIGEERLARLVLEAFVRGLDPEQPSIELPLRLVEQRRLDEVVERTLGTAGRR